VLSPTPYRSETPSSSALPLDTDVLLDQAVESCVADLPVTLQTLFSLNFQGLSTFEVITQQFSQQGITFERAIALAPSNPKFIEQPGQKILMPMGQSQSTAKHQMLLQLQPMVTQISMAGRSTQPILLEVLDVDGTVVAVQNGVMCPLPQSLQHDTSRLPSQVFKLEPLANACLRLSAKAPFVLFNIAV